MGLSLKRKKALAPPWLLFRLRGEKQAEDEQACREGHLGNLLSPLTGLTTSLAWQRLYSFMIVLNGPMADTVDVWCPQVRIQIMLGHSVLSQVSRCMPSTWHGERLRMLLTNLQYKGEASHCTAKMSLCQNHNPATRPFSKWQIPSGLAPPP